MPTGRAQSTSSPAFARRSTGWMRPERGSQAFAGRRGCRSPGDVRIPAGLPQAADRLGMERVQRGVGDRRRVGHRPVRASSRRPHRARRSRPSCGAWRRSIPPRCSVADWNSATTLDVLSMHDTMNHTARPDGAICLERQPVDRLPAVVAMSNRGDSNGDVIASDEPTLRDDDRRADDGPDPSPRDRQRLPHRLRCVGARRRRVQPSVHRWPRDHDGGADAARDRAAGCRATRRWSATRSSVSAPGRTSSSASSCWVPSRPSS